MDSFVYPDVAVSCGETKQAAVHSESLVNPVLVVEVLSKSTEGYDYGNKFQKYMTLASLQEYVLVNQYRPLVRVYNRQKDNSWSMVQTIGLEGSIKLHSLDAIVSMADIYYNIKGLETMMWVEEDGEK